MQYVVEIPGCVLRVKLKFHAGLVPVMPTLYHEYDIVVWHALLDNDDMISTMFKPLFIRSPPQLPPPLPCASAECYDKRYLLYAGPNITSRVNGVDYKVLMVHSYVLKHFMQVAYEHFEYRRNCQYPCVCYRVHLIPHSIVYTRFSRGCRTV